MERWLNGVRFRTAKRLMRLAIWLAGYHQAAKFVLLVQAEGRLHATACTHQQTPAPIEPAGRSRREG